MRDSCNCLNEARFESKEKYGPCGWAWIHRFTDQRGHFAYEYRIGVQFNGKLTCYARSTKGFSEAFKIANQRRDLPGNRLVAIEEQQVREERDRILEAERLRDLDRANAVEAELKTTVTRVNGSEWRATA